MSEKLVRNYSDEVSKRYWESLEKSSAAAPKLTASQQDINQIRSSAGLERLSPTDSASSQTAAESEKGS